jgi:uncharacterized membrane protein
MESAELLRRIGALELRIDSIERHLQLSNPVPLIMPAPPPRVPVMPAATPPTPLPIQPIHLEYPTAPISPAPAPATIPLSAAALFPVESSRRRRSVSFERTLGLKWSGWIGAIAVLVGLALGVRFAYEQGWFGVFPDSVRLGMLALVGFALIGAGEWAYRCVHVVPAASLFAAGIGVLFLCSYTGYAYFRLYEPGAAFILMSLCTLIGATVARRANMVSIGVLCLLGGYVTPLLIHSAHPQLFGFVCYLAMLEAIALVLVFAGADSKWWALRILAWSGTALWMAAVISSSAFGSPAPALTLGAAVVFALGFQAELIASTARWGEQARGPANASMALSILVTAGLTVLGLQILPLDAVGQRIAFISLELVACAALAVPLRRRAAALASGFVIQSCALLALLVPVALSGESVILGWGVMAVAAAAVGRLRDSNSARAMAVGVWLLAIGDLLWRLQYVPPVASIHAVWLSVHGVQFSAGLVLGWLLALMGFASAWLILPAQSNQRAEIVRAGFALCLLSAAAWIGISIDQLPPLTSTLSIIALAWLLAGADAATERLWFGLQAICLLLLATVKWAAVDAIAARLSVGWSAMDQHPLVNGLMGTALLLAISIPALYLWRRRSIQRVPLAHLPFALAMLVIVLLTIGLSLQIDLMIQRAVDAGGHLPWPPMQMEQLAFTLLWSASVAALCVVARRWNDPRYRFVSQLPLLLIAKFMAVDTLLLWHGASGGAVGLNLLVATGVAVALVTVGATMIRWRPSAAGLTAALFTLGWTAMFEIDRAVSRGLLSGWAPWPHMQLTQTLLTATWAAAAAALFLLVHLSQPGGDVAIYRGRAAVVLVLLGLKFLTVDTIGFWLSGSAPRAMVLLNPQALTAAVLICALGLVWLTWPTDSSKLPRVAGFLAMLIILWIGTLEIDRLFSFWISSTVFPNLRLAEQVAISVFWAVFAVAAVLGGFKLGTASLRYFGLALFGITLAKIVLVDLSQASSGLRFLSLIGVGGLLLGTSLLYGKLAPHVLDSADHRPALPLGEAGATPGADRD